jgi:hypothetical protein
MQPSAASTNDGTESFSKEKSVLAALKDMIAVFAAIVVLIYSTGQREWLWRQIAVAQQIALAEARQDWGCPSISSKSACKKLVGVR